MATLVTFNNHRNLPAGTVHTPFEYITETERAAMTAADVSVNDLYREYLVNDGGTYSTYVIVATDPLTWVQMAIGGAGHVAVTLDGNADAVLSLSTQELGLDSQTQNYVFAAPSDGAGVPAFRALVDADIPSALARDSELHDAVTLDGNADAVLSLSTQELGLDSQTQNYVFAAPSGGAGVPAFRALVAADLAAHASTHIDGDEIDGDKLDIDFSPSNYVPDASASEADDTDDLAAHLNGIDSALNSFWSRNPSTPSRIDNNTLSVSDNTANQNFYVPGRIIGFEISSTWYYAVIKSYSSGTIEIEGDDYSSAVDVYGLNADAKDIVHNISGASDGDFSTHPVICTEDYRVLAVYAYSSTLPQTTSAKIKLWRTTTPNASSGDAVHGDSAGFAIAAADGESDLDGNINSTYRDITAWTHYLVIEADDVNDADNISVIVKCLPKVLRLKLEG